MDMKKILQAFDGASAKKPVEGSNSMAKFLRIVDETAINQAPAAAVPPMPDVSDLQPGASKDGEEGSKITKNADGTVSYAGGWGTYIYNAQGQHVKTQSPAVAGYQQTSNAQGQVTDKSYNMGDLSVQQGPQGTQASYTMGDKTLSQTRDPQGNVTQQSTTPVQESSISKFLSIVDKNNVSILNEGANPHKVSLPVQMAMNHFQTPAKAVEKKPSLLKKYFAEAEELFAEEAEKQASITRQYSQKIAKQVLMKESALKDKEDLKAKRKALQDIQLDPHTHKDPELKAELAKRKADLEKEAKSKKLDENQQEPMRDLKVIQQEMAALKPQLDLAEHAFRQARKLTTSIKHEDPTHDIIVGLQSLITKGLTIDQRDFEMAINEVTEQMGKLQSAVYALDDPFEEAVRTLKYQMDELESEISEIEYQKKYGRGE